MRTFMFGNFPGVAEVIEGAYFMIRDWDTFDFAVKSGRVKIISVSDLYDEEGNHLTTDAIRSVEFQCEQNA